MTAAMMVFACLFASLTVFFALLLVVEIGTRKEKEKERNKK